MSFFKRKKVRIIICTCLIISFLPIQKVQADIWGAAYASAILKQALERIVAVINGLILGTAKQMAAKMVRKTLGKLILGGNGGDSDGPLYITNWDQYLYTEVANSANIVANDFFTMTTRGTNSAINYAAETAGSATSNYASYITLQAQQAINETVPQMDILSYVSEPSQMFEQGNWRGFSAFISNAANSPHGMSGVLAPSVYQGTLEKERKKAEVQAIAYQGYKASKSGSEVLTPGSTIKDLQSSVQNMGYSIIATAQNIPEVITATVIQTASEIIQQGIGNAKSRVQKEVNNKINSVKKDTNESIQTGGPGATYKSKY